MKKNQLTVRVLSGIDVGEVPEVIRLLPKGHVLSLIHISEPTRH